MSEIKVTIVGTTSQTAIVSGGETVNVTFANQGGVSGNPVAATIEVGSVATVDATASAEIVNSGTAYAAKLDFKIPRGPAAGLSIGTVTSGTVAAATITGNAPSQVLSLTLPPGPPSSLSIGTVTSGTAAAATITGNAPSQVLSLVIPPGQTGAQGPQGDAGPVTSLSIGTVTSGTAAAATITGNAPSQVLSLTLPVGKQGDPGPYTTIAVGTVTTGSPGSNASISTATSGSTVTLNFTIPAGVPGSVNLGDETPQPPGSASAGTALTAARADHVHETPTISYLNLTNVPSTFTPASHTQTISTVTGLQAALDGLQPAGNYATLVGGTVPSSQLPSYVDDVIEAANLASFAATGEVGKIYVARDTNKTYRWSGSTYVEISASPGSTDAVPEGSTNLYFTALRASNASPVQSVAGRTGTITLTGSDVSGVVTSVNNLTGSLTLAAGGNVTLSSNGSTLTIAASGGGGALGENDAIDGGTYIGELLYGITFTSQPQSQTVNSTQNLSFSTTNVTVSGSNGANIIGSGLFSVGSDLFAPAREEGYDTSPPYSLLTAAAGLAASTDNGATWSFRNVLEQSYSAYSLNANATPSVASNGSRWVWVPALSGGSGTSGNHAKLQYSDSSNLTTSSALSILNPLSVAYSATAGRWVAVTSGSIYSSTDGANWTLRETPAHRPVGVFVVGGTFVVLSTNPIGNWRSTNGINWTNFTIENGYFGSAASSGSKIVALQGSGNAYWSSDGVYWQTSQLPVAGLARMSYAAGLFWAFPGSASTDVATSPDGINWTLRDGPASVAWQSAASAEGSNVIFATRATNGAPHLQVTSSVVAGSANLTVSAVAGSGNPVAYQWQNSLDAGGTWGNVSNATNTTLSLPNLTPADNGTRYRALATANGATPACSQSAILTVTG